MTREQLNRQGFSNIVERERIRHEQRQGRGYSVESEAIRRIKKRGGKVTDDSIESELDYMKEQED